MTQTVISSVVPYATPQNLVDRHDFRPLFRLLQDNDTAAVPNLATVLNDTRTTEFLMSASADLEGACLRGRRYSVADLQALTATNAGALIRRIVTDLACLEFYDRRPMLGLEPPKMIERSLEYLKALEKGEAIFGFAEAAAAGIVASEVETPMDVANRNGRVVIAQRYFGRRADRTWPPF